MEKQKLELVNVELKEASVALEFLNEEQTEVIEMSLFKQEYDKASNSWNDSEEVTERFNRQLQDGFGLFDENELTEKVGQTYELFVDENKGTAYVEEPQSLGLSKPTLEQAGDDADGTVIQVIEYDTNKMVVVELEDGIRYGVNYNYGKYNKTLEKYLISKVDLVKKKAKFEKETKINWEKSDDLVGKEVRIDFKSFKLGQNEIPYVALKKVL